MSQTAFNSFIHAGPAPLVNTGQFAVRIRQWELMELAGEGSLARVYRARPATGPAERAAAYALKMLRPQCQDNLQAIALLQREAMAGAHVRHPHVIPILGAHVSDAPRLLVMPWLEGTTVHARLAAGERFPTARALWIARQVAEALDAFHRAGWLHGDVTPANIHVSPTGHVTLLDLSFARRCDEFGSAVDRPIMGTCNYIAPEQLTSVLRSDIRSDIYGLGAVLFEMFGGRPPYRARTLTELVDQQRNLPTPELLTLAPGLPPGVFALVRQMLARDPLRRPQTPRELIERLVALEIAAFRQCE